MTKRTQPDYVKKFQDALNDFVQDLHPMGGMLTGAITIVEMIDSNGKYFLHVLDDNKSPNWKLQGMISEAGRLLDEKFNTFDEDED
jgi:hypothetical protein